MLSNNVGQPAIIDENADKVATFVLYNHARIVQLLQASEELSAKNQQNSETKVIIFQCIQNKCSVGPEASIPEIEKLKAQLPFPREEKVKAQLPFPREDKETAETFSIEGILVSCPTDTFFLPLKLHDPNQKSMK